MLRLVVLALLGAVLAAVPAVAAERTVVKTKGARAVVTHDPLRITFKDARGRTVLQQVDGAGAEPFAVLPVPNPVPVGQDAYRAPALYAPLTFTVGTNQIVQAPGAQYVGNVVTGVEAGVSFSATKVIAARRAGRGAVLEAATTDPTGRTLTVRLSPSRQGGIRLRARPSDPAGVSAMGDAFVSPAGEAFRGFGGRHNSLDQRGQDFINWTQQENTGAGSAETTDDRVLFPNGETAAYYVQSQFLGSRYGFLLDRDELSRWRMGSDRDDAWNVQVAAPALDYVVWPGGPRPVIRRMTAVTGRHRPPPRWALGGIWDRQVKYPSDNAADYLAGVEQDLADFKRYKTPVSAYRLEGWEFLTDDQLRATIAKIKKAGMRPMVYFRAFVGQDTIGTDDPARYDEALAKGYVATREDGSPYTFVSNFQAQAALIDFTDPAAVRWWKGRIRQVLRLGVSGFMQDFGEQTLADMHFDDGSTGLQMHNRYGKLYHRATREALDRWKKTHRRAKLWFFTRTGYSGTPGTPAYENANFAGDATTDFGRASGLASQTPDMLNRSITGAYGFTTDIGGYFDLGPYPATTKELFNRWAAWAALSPYFRLHGSVFNGIHTPWSYDQETVDNYNRFTRLHLRARPLLARLFRRAARTGLPPTRPLWLAAPSYAPAVAEDQEWLLGPNVLVAPVVEAGATGRRVVFPPGCWRGGGRRYRGPTTAEVTAGLGKLPYFVRCGTRPFRRR